MKALHRARRPARFWLTIGAAGAAALVLGAVLVAAWPHAPSEPPQVSSQVRTTHFPIAPWTGSMAVDEDGPAARTGCTPAAPATTARKGN